MARAVDIVRRVAVLGLAGVALGLAASMVAPRVVSPATWVLLAAFASYAAARVAAGPGRGRWAGWLERAWRRADGAAVWVLQRGKLTAAVAAACLMMLAAWAPHYLTWPWWLDLDTYAEMAQAWSMGEVPYRDIRVFNFPGQIYLFYLLGRVTGWGYTAPVYAVDAAMVAALGVGLAAWSRRRFGWALPGLVGYARFLSFYLGLVYYLAAQRDWHASFFVVLALLALESWPGRRGRLASSASAALALAFRPQTVLFLPALASAVDEGARREGEPLGRSARGLAEWGLMFAGFAALVFLPLALSGAARGFAEGVSRAAFGPHNRVTAASLSALALAQIRDPRLAALLALMAALAVLGPRGLRRPARTWLLALLAAFAYKPISPFPHDYLIIPLNVVGAVAVAFAVEAVLAWPRMSPALAVAAVGWVAWNAGVGVPSQCDPERSLEAVALLARGEAPRRTPTGAAYLIGTDRPVEGSYATWSDYQALSAYLRRLPPSTRVANLLRSEPMLSVNGALGRRSVFPFESGVVWAVSGGDPSWEMDLVRSLGRSPDSVVVWTPGFATSVPGLRLPRLERAVVRLYEPSARFGSIEVWSRRPAAGGLTGLRGG